MSYFEHMSLQWPPFAPKSVFAAADTASIFRDTSYSGDSIAKGHPPECVRLGKLYVRDRRTARSNLGYSNAAFQQRAEGSGSNSHAS